MPRPQGPGHLQDLVSDFVSHVQLAPHQYYKVLTVWPLVQREGAPPLGGPDYVPLASALAEGSVVVDEVSERGSVPHVRVANRGSRPVLFLFGEEIVGAKQNRVANATFLVPARGEVVLDVSCVEAGRWGRRTSRDFGHADQVLSAALRRKMARKVSRSVRTGMRFAADQGEVWHEIGERIARTGTRSSTEAWADYRESRGADLREIDAAFRPVPGQVGFVASLGDSVAGIEVVGRPEVFAASFRALLRSYAIDAVDAALVRDLEGESPARRARFDAPEPFLEALRESAITAAPSLGLGSDLRLEGPGVEGCALACDGLVHLTAFPA